jgi:hypothetical protein
MGDWRAFAQLRQFRLPYRVTLLAVFVLTVVLDLTVSVNGRETTNTLGTLPPALVRVGSGAAGWLVFYSLDGTALTADTLSNGQFYVGEFGLEASATVWPVAFNEDFTQRVEGLPVRVNVLRPQTLTVTGGEGAVHQGPGVDIAAASDSGLPVVLEVLSGPGRLEGGKLVPTGGGVVRLRAQQVGNDLWASAVTEVERTVAKATQLLTWGSVSSATFGDAALSVTVTSGSGLPVSLAVLEGPGSLVSGKLALTGAGIIRLRASQAGNGDFAPASSDWAITVSKGPRRSPSARWRIGPMVPTASR